MQAETSEARIAMLVRVLAGSVILLGLIATYKTAALVGPPVPSLVSEPTRLGGQVFVRELELGPTLLGIGVVLLLVPGLWRLAATDPPQMADRAKHVMLFGGSILIIAALLAAASFLGHSETLGWLTTLVLILLGPPCLLLLVAGGILIHRSATLSLIAATAVLIVVWVVMHRERSLVVWTPIADARSNAASKHKLIMYDFSAEWCGPCKLMERDVFNDPRLAATINDKFIPVRVMDRRQEEGRNPPAVEDLQRRFAVRAFPTIVFADETLAEADRGVGYRNKADIETLIDGVAHPVLVVPTSVQSLDNFDAPLNWTAFPYAVKLNISQDTVGAGARCGWISTFRVTHVTQLHARRLI